jgi:acyl-phosphate glycerol 3-phosphate acyltransferase
MGSVVWGVVLGRWLRGRDPRARDNPGGSGSFRQLGPAIGIAVTALDACKGAAAVGLARWLGASATGTALAAVAAVAGHNWPIWFGFRGGGGLATTLGALTTLSPVETLWALAITLVVAAVYKLPGLYGRLPMAALPFGALAGLPAAVFLSWRAGNGQGAAAALLCGIAVTVRGLQMAGEHKERGDRR